MLPANMARKFNRARYRTRLENNLCPRCGKERDSEFISCSPCRLKALEIQKRHKERKKNKTVRYLYD